MPVEKEKSIRLQLDPEKRKLMRTVPFDKGKRLKEPTETINENLRVLEDG